MIFEAETIELLEVECCLEFDNQETIYPDTEVILIARPKFRINDELFWAVDKHGQPLPVGCHISAGETADILVNGMEFIWSVIPGEGQGEVPLDQQEGAVILQDTPWIAKYTPPGEYSGDLQFVVKCVYGDKPAANVAEKIAAASALPPQKPAAPPRLAVKRPPKA